MSIALNVMIRQVNVRYVQLIDIFLKTCVCRVHQRTIVMEKMQFRTVQMLLVVLIPLRKQLMQDVVANL